MKPRIGPGVVVDEADLLHRARQTRSKAYAPYSSFHVGAVALSRRGDLYEGVNVENASYGLAMCAERVAIGAMVAAGDRSGLAAIAVVADGDAACTPCGACRQVIFEFGDDVVVYASGDGGRPLTRTIGELLPNAFGPLRLAQGRDD